MDGRCATCRWWGAGIDGTVIYDEDRIFLAQPDRDGHKVCALTITHGHGDGYEDTDTTRMLAYAEDYDGEPRGLWTLPGFGCVQYKPS